MNERERIAMLARVLGAPPAGVLVGIGDDAAVLDAAGRPGAYVVWTIDEQVERVHFRRDWLSWHDVGWRATMAAASDVSAMGATPWCALCAVVVPDDVDDAALEAIAEGQAAAGRELAAPIVGGNLSRGAALSLATTFLGRCGRAIGRSGAHPREGLWLAGAVGLAAAGLRALERGVDDTRVLPAVAAWRTPRAQVAAGHAMRMLATAAVDVSDGVAGDVGHLAAASGLQAVLDEDALCADPALRAAAAALAAAPIDLALHGGEDYAIVAASPAPLPGFRRIGELREGEGVVVRSPAGERAVDPAGFDHFTDRSRRPAASRT
jgi:thiamine-monophosphate kinase